jgi:hypothetical protein
MGSYSIQEIRQAFPGIKDAEAVKAFAKKNNYVAMVQYKISKTSPQFTHIGACSSKKEISGYFSSPSCYSPEVVYDDGRASFLDGLDASSFTRDQQEPDRLSTPSLVGRLRQKFRL